MPKISLASVGLDNSLSSIPVISAFFTNWTLFKGEDWENPPWYSCLVVIKVSFIQFKRDVIRNNFPSQIKRSSFSEFISTLWEAVPLIHHQGIICGVAFDRSSLRRIAPYASVVAPRRLASNTLLVIRNMP